MQAAPTQTSAVNLEAISQIAITVRDLPQATHFYRDILGMQFLFNAGSMAFFQCGSIRFLVGLAENQTTPIAQSGTILYFKVSDIQSTYAALSEQAVPFLQPPHLAASMPDHDLWLAFFKDPDANTFGLLSEIPRSS